MKKKLSFDMTRNNPGREMPPLYPGGRGTCKLESQEGECPNSAEKRVRQDNPKRIAGEFEVFLFFPFGEKREMP